MLLPFERWFLKEKVSHIVGQLGKVKSPFYCFLPPILSLFLSEPQLERGMEAEALKVLEKKRGQVSSLPIKTAPAPEPGSLLQLFLTFRARERNRVCFWSLSNPSYLILSIRMNISSPKVATLRRNMVALKNYYHSTQSSPIWTEGLVNNCLQLRWSQWNWTIQLQSWFWDLLAVNLQQVS